MPLTLKQIRYFIGVCDAGQISAAARTLNVSQSTVTLSIQELEADLGVQLFERHRSGLRLTQMGEVFLNRAREIEASVAFARDSVTNDTEQVVGTIRLGVTHVLSGYFLFPRLARFKRIHPYVKVELRELKRQSLEQDILSGQIDLGLMLTSNLSETDKIEKLDFHCSNRHLWVSSSHPLLEKEKVSLFDVAQHPYVSLNADECEIAAKTYWRAAKVMPREIFSTTSIEAVRSMVALGEAVTILSDVVYRPWSLDGGRVEKRVIDETLPTMNVGLAWKKGRAFSVAETAFQDMILKEL